MLSGLKSLFTKKRNGSLEEQMSLRRRELSKKYITGQGLEIGALHAPLWTSDRASVKYVDRFDVTMLRKHYPELAGYQLVDIDIIDNGEKLANIEDGKVDFIIANHMLEHCKNPLQTIKCHLTKIREDGRLFCSVPDKRYTFDAERPLTTFEHLVKDDKEGPETTEHYYEYAKFVHKLSNSKEIEAEAKRLMEVDYSIHFHVWDFDTFNDFLIKAQAYLKNSFRIVCLEQNHHEIIVILAKGK